jgi:hypothetical protein
MPVTTSGTRRISRPGSKNTTGSGARLLAAIATAGIPFEIVWIWRKSSRDFERRVHLYKNTPRLCPICMNTDRHARRYASRRTA